MRPRIFDLLFNDDRMFVLELCPVESRNADSVMLASGKRAPGKDSEWSVVTRRNVPDYPPHRVDPFPTREQALAYYKSVVVQTPRRSLGEKSPDPAPTLAEYTAWLVENQLFDPVLNPNAPR